MFEAPPISASWWLRLVVLLGREARGFVLAGAALVAALVISFAPNPDSGPAAQGAYVDEVLSYIAAGTRYAVTANRQYSPSALIDTSGNVVERYTYDAYGQRTVLSAAGMTIGTDSTVAFERGYTGLKRDPETGILVAYLRMYDPSLGRWIQRDPARYVDGLNLYAAYFVPNQTDALGLSVVDDIMDWLTGLVFFQPPTSNPVPQGDKVVAAVGSLKGLAVDLVHNYMYNNGLDFKLSRDQLADVAPITSLTNSPSFNGYLKFFCTKCCAKRPGGCHFEGDFALPAVTAFNGTLGNFTVNASVKVDCQSPTDWSATGTASVFDIYQFPLKLKAFWSEKGNGRSIAGELRTLAGTAIGGTPFRVGSEAQRVDQTSAMSNLHWDLPPASAAAHGDRLDVDSASVGSESPRENGGENENKHTSENR